MKSAAAGAAILVAALSSGCATTGPAPRQVELGGDCVRTVAELPVNPVYVSAYEGGKVATRDFAELARCVEASDGSKIAAALFRLEQAPSPANLRVVMSEKAGQVLAAAVTTLDEGYATLGRTGFEKFVNRGTTNTVDIVLNDPRVRYVLLSPDETEVGKSEKTYATQYNSAVVPAGPVFFVVNTGSANENRRAYSDAGYVSVLLTPAAPRPVLAK